MGGCTTTARINAAGFNEASVLCTQGSGTYRAVVLLPPFSLSAFPPPIDGPIVQVGQTSKAIHGTSSGVLVKVIVARSEIVS